MAKHFPLAVTDTTFSFARRKEKIAAEAAIDGIYAVRASSREEGLVAATIDVASARSPFIPYAQDLGGSAAPHTTNYRRDRADNLQSGLETESMPRA